MRITVLVVAITLVLPATHAEAINAFKNGSDLLRGCTAENLFIQAQCIGYIEGVTDAFSVGRETRDGLPPCMPATTEEGKIQDAVVDYLRKNPADQTSPAALLISKVIMTNWDCAAAPKTEK
jgi:Rap1a immunity proteins